MTLKTQDLRALALLAVAVIAIVIYRSTGSATPEVVSSADSAALLETRLAKLRQIAATVPGKTAVLNDVRSQLQAREKNILVFATAAQAQAHLLEVVHRISTANKFEARGGDFTPPTLLGNDYGQVGVSVIFECRIEDFVNFLADLSKEPELISPSDIHISAGNAKSKTINVHMMLAGVVPKTLVPKKRGLELL